MADVQVTFKTDQFMQALTPAVSKGLFAAATVGAAKASELVSTKSFPDVSAPGEPPSRDTGQLEESIAAVHPARLGTPLKAFYGASKRYARKLEFGGIIRAKKGKFLVVPVNRLLARRVIARGGGKIKGNPLLQFVPSPKGGGVLVLKDKARIGYGSTFKKIRGKASETFAAGTVVFVLKKQVVIQPRPFMARSAQLAAPAMKDAFVRSAREELMKVATVDRK